MGEIPGLDPLDVWFVFVEIEVREGQKGGDNERSIDDSRNAVETARPPRIPSRTRRVCL